MARLRTRIEGRRKSGQRKDVTLAEKDFRKKILIIYVAAGSGHTTYSRAIKSGLEKLFPGKYIIKEMDYIKEIGPASFDRSSKNIWNFMLRHPYAGRLFDSFVEKFQPLAQAIELAWSQKHIKNSVRFINDYKPDIIIAPHPQTLRAAVITRKKLGLKTPVIGIVIEPFSGGAVYDHPGADKIVVFSEQAKTRLIKKGVPENKLPVFDFIIDSKFLKDYDSIEKTRKKLGLEPGILTIMMSSGGDGIGNLEKYIKSTIMHTLPVQLAVLTGRNAKLKEKLEKIKLPRDSKTVLKIFGFIENFDDFLYASDVVFGKGGAGTTVESLFMKKPVIFYRFVTGNEKRNIDFVRKNRLGWYTHTTRGFIHIIKGILKNPETLDQIKRNYERLNFKAGTETFCRFVVGMLEPGEKGASYR
jgi:UDP-N-acetylglucosamine:LPS N-acetylglucosamine transferase